MQTPRLICLLDPLPFSNSFMYHSRTCLSANIETVTLLFFTPLTPFGIYWSPPLFLSSAPLPYPPPLFSSPTPLPCPLPAPLPYSPPLPVLRFHRKRFQNGPELTRRTGRISPVTNTGRATSLLVRSRITRPGTSSTTAS